MCDCCWEERPSRAGGYKPREGVQPGCGQTAASEEGPVWERSQHWRTQGSESRRDCFLRSLSVSLSKQVLLFFRRGKANRQEMTATEKRVYYTRRSQERTCMSHDGGTRGEAPVSVLRERKAELVGKSLYCGFCGKERARQGKQAHD